MGQTVVTVGAWKRNRGPLLAGSLRLLPQRKTLSVNRGWDNYPGWNDDQQPMFGVSWIAAERLCEAAGMRLPTEAEWEYAARAGSVASRYAELDEIAWYGDNSGKEHFDSEALWKSAPVRKDYLPPGDKYWDQLKSNGSGPHDVGLKEPNAWNLYDMLGNVSQWTAGKLIIELPRSISPAGGDIEEYAMRGGSWFHPPSFVRVSSHDSRLVDTESGVHEAHDNTSGAVRCVGQ